jgi:hypothetical protein
VCGWREADEQQASERITEAGNRTTPVAVVAVGSALVAGDLLTISTEARAAFASDNRVANRSELAVDVGRGGFHPMCCES